MPEGLRGGIHTHWRVMGQGEDPALMIHCSLAHAGAWKGLAAELGDRLSMLACDLPGHGKSADWDGVTRYQDVALAQAMDLLRLDVPDGAPVHLMGHSFGATVALRLAVEHPERVRSLVLIEPVFFSVALADNPGLKDEESPTDRALREATLAGDLMAAARVFHGSWGDGRDFDAMTPEQQEALARRMPLIEAVRVTNTGDPGGMLVERKLERLALPVLLLDGAESPAKIALIQAGLERRLPDVRRAVIPGAAHMAPITHPAAVAAEVRAFLDGVAARGRQGEA